MKFEPKALECEYRLERRIFIKALVMGLLMHGIALAGLAMDPGPGKPDLVPLAVMDFSEFDPFGGQGGDGGDGGPVAEAPDGPETKPEPEPDQFPELEAEPEDLTLLESLAEQAEVTPVLAPPPPSEKPMAERPKPKVKPKPATPVEASSQGINPDGVIGGIPGAGDGGPGGTPGGTGTGNPNEMNAYKNKVRQRLERRKKYPSAAQSRGLAGTATVSFIVAKDGSVHSSSLVKSSGHQLLDDEAVALPVRCSPLPPLPNSFVGANLKLTVPLKFSVR
ncbi:MAG: TonB family protein [Deltaproteobacteria bacterium]|nr:TonB family protein [Deltaproteobacteria bacterium]